MQFPWSSSLSIPLAHFLASVRVEKDLLICLLPIRLMITLNEYPFLPFRLKIVAIFALFLKANCSKSVPILNRKELFGSGGGI